MLGWIILLLLALIVVLTTVAAHFYRRCSLWRAKMEYDHERLREISGFLNRFSTGLQSEDGVDGAMHAAARHVLEQIGAESSAIYELSAGELRVVGVCGTYPLIHSTNRLLFSKHHHLFAALRRERIRVGEGFLGELAAERKAELVADASADRRFTEYPYYTSFHSIMAVPLVRDGNCVGMICVCTDRRHPEHKFSDRQFKQLNMLTGQVLMVSNLVRVYNEISRRDRIDQELEFAHSLQTSLLPPAFPAWGNFTIDAMTRSAKEVDGDFYDFIEIDADRMLVMLGDACGKGIPACMLTAMTRSIARSLTDNFIDLSDFIGRLNDKLRRGIDADRFITLGCCLLDRKNSTVEFARAGHTDLLCYVHDHFRAFSPDGTALGILPAEFSVFDTISFAFPPKTTLMMFSDGLNEALNKNQEEFGAERLRETFCRASSSGGSSKEIIGQILETVTAFESEQNDDQTIVLIRHVEQ